MRHSELSNGFLLVAVRSGTAAENSGSISRVLNLHPLLSENIYGVFEMTPV